MTLSVEESVFLIITILIFYVDNARIVISSSFCDVTFLSSIVKLRPQRVIHHGTRYKFTTSFVSAHTFRNSIQLIKNSHTHTKPELSHTFSRRDYARCVPC